MRQTGEINCLLLNFKIDNDFPVVLQARTRKLSKFQPIIISYFSFSKDVLLQLSNNDAEFYLFIH